MRNKLLSALLACASGLVTFAAPALAADVGVSVSVGQPGFYGQVDIGDYPRPQLIYRQPVTIERSYSQHAPIYLNVPPGHAKKWSKHCAAYNACGRPVYFVQNSWYEQQYVPRYQERHGRDERRDDRGDGRRDEHRNDQGDGRGQGGDERGRGHDQGHRN